MLPFFVNLRGNDCSSEDSDVVQLGDLVVEWLLHAAGVVCVVLAEAGQTLDAVPVLLELGVLFEEEALADPVHQVAHLEQDEVNIGDLASHKEWLIAQELHDRLDFLEQVSSDGGAVT